MPEIWFNNLNIQIQHLDRVAFTVMGVSVYYYGICIALAFFCGLMLSVYNAKRLGIDENIYYDFIIYAMIFGIIGARIYYVIFSWDYYSNNLLDIFMLRDGGLGLYGGVIGGCIAYFFYAKIKKLEFFKIIDVAMPGLSLGQAIGRFGNFFNREAFGGYTDGLFAMRLRVDTLNYLPKSLESTVFSVNNYDYIQVQPTFLYESVWNLLVCATLMFYTKKKKFDGEIFFLYFLLYGIGRFIIESMRTDQLYFLGTKIPVSMLVSLVFSVTSLVFIILKRRKLYASNKNVK